MTTTSVKGRCHQLHVLRANKYASQALYQTLQKTKLNFEKLLGYFNASNTFCGFGGCQCILKQNYTVICC